MARTHRSRLDRARRDASLFIRRRAARATAHLLGAGILGVGIALAARIVPCAAESSATFRSASPDYSLEFPRDHGQHREFETEWWYYTGILAARGGNVFDAPRFGFQLTFFRRAVDAATTAEPVQHLYLAHAAFTEIAEGTYRFSSRKARGGLGLAGADDDRLDVFHRGWRATEIAGHHLLELSLPEKNGGSQVAIRLLATPSGAPLLQGDKGYSRKGGCPTCASHYYSMPRLAVEGEVRDGDTTTPVTGLAWMDHEFMTNALQAEQVGWDWFGLMLKDGTNLMLFKLRRADGSTDFAHGTIERAGSTRSLAPADFTIEPLSTWTSPRSNARYPSRWRVRIPDERIALELEPLVKDQETGEAGQSDGPIYWEGAVRDGSGAAVGYAELTGYAKPLEAEL